MGSTAVTADVQYIVSTAVVNVSVAVIGVTLLL